MPGQPLNDYITPESLLRESSSFGDYARRLAEAAAVCSKVLVNQCQRAACGHCIPCDVERVLVARARRRRDE